MTVYCMDTDVLIDAVKVYPRDVFSRLWQMIEQWGQNGLVVAPSEVLLELSVVDDDASAWAKANKHIFKPPHEAVQVAVKEVLARFPALVPPDASRPFADPWVVAQAMAEGAVVVSKERPAAANGKPKVPNVCEAFGVRCIKLLGMLRDMNLGY